jgi:aminoglycoside phosphotransferase (APT) family kinase protein
MRCRSRRGRAKVCGVVMHENQVHVTGELVRLLVDDQFPEWRQLPLQEVIAAGTDNAIFRIGDDLAARFPLHAQEADEAWSSLESEARALRELAACSPVPAPVPVALGAPGHGYPLPWAVQTWLPGRVATQEDPGSSVAFAEDLAGFITGLRAVDTQGRPFSGRGRGGHLPDHDAWMDVCFERSEGLLDVDRLRRLWGELRVLPRESLDVMSHKDLIPGNVLVRDGRLVGVLDGGAFGPADPALDLVAGWHLLEQEPRAALRRALGCGEVEWGRGMAWACEQSMGLVWYYAESNPTMSGLGRRTLNRLLDEA